MAKMTSLENAVANARNNANFFGKPYVVFIDASGNHRSERHNPNLTCHSDGRVFHPKKEEKS